MTALAKSLKVLWHLLCVVCRCIRPHNRSMRAISGDEVQLDPAAWLRQPGLHQPGVVVGSIVRKQVDEPLARVERRNGDRQPDDTAGIDAERFHHDRVTGFQIERALNNEALAACGLHHRDFSITRRPSPDGLRAMHRMHGIFKQHHFIIFPMVQSSSRWFNRFS